VVENHQQSQRRVRTDILPGSRPPYTLVPPIATNFDSLGYVQNARSPISPKGGSRDNTPRTTPTSAKGQQFRNSILDEVEGSLTDTLREFQGLQGFLHQDSPPITPDQVFGPPPLYQSHDQSHNRRDSSNSIQPDDSFVSSLQHSTWDPSQMAAAVAQQHGSVFSNTNGTQSLSHASMRNGFQPNGTLTGEYADYDPKLLAVQHAYEEQKKVMHALQLESDNVKRRLDFLRQRLSEFEQEKTALVRSARDAEEKMQIALTKLRDAKVGEMAAQREFLAAKNSISILETRCDEERRKNVRLTEEIEGERETCEKVQAKLEEANTHKVDLLERELESRKEIIVTKKKLKKAVDELNAHKRKDRIDAAQVSEAETHKKRLQDTQTQLNESRKQNSILEEELRKLSPQSELPFRITEMAFRIEAMEAELAARDERITMLESQNDSLTSLDGQFLARDAHVLSLESKIASLTTDLATLASTTTPPSSSSTSATTITSFNNPATSTTARSSSSAPSSPRNSATELESMRRMLEQMDKTRRELLAEKEKLSSLLHAELRRVVVEEHERKHPSLPFLMQKPELEAAIAVVKARAEAYVREQHGAEGSDDRGEQEGNEEEKAKKLGDLQREIEYYLNDIVLYKLDVKGYKKDLRKAERKIKELTEQQDGQQPRQRSRSERGRTNTMSTVTTIAAADRGSPDTIGGAR
jgi:DNA repair exonuclease SbcCD ATPase subunit